ncbi:Protein methyltransferase hemK [Vibrio nigripulchritudo SFn27]|uniref:Release factor glutamine methyltransferase n=1 Tax=Vibrio nigripulchritudo TaxID=28173 RepID=U4K0H0_9VIBR|nr:peptide chain release factor N(5)-glutamine methyltransferase [Vibrio nigripulchritudo]CCN84512.1 Protein methyltransferase hemK [Vibrio nigripulchritudo BLFn1]CCN91005.1 Protein methyltransferase hemK [Vibrio nigripulchritudo SFn27]CCN95420.1 Protein methyltransferase hemK [Vibrio nigripulchritudo ENn2]CCO41373.1 Protein methyltransferase hemK [Vibrio nigripulchritudo SFn135]CCO55886.1 Protein methyltransferase hemK [Vibrio nigripulchritudo Wn13]
MPLSIEDTLKAATEKLMESGSESPSLDAAVLLCHALDKPRSYLLTWPEKLLTPEQDKDFVSLLERRQNGEPVAYIVGEREFWSLPLKVSPSTLIPRPDTERLVELALEKIRSTSGSVLDLGTGTGAIALAIASELPSHNIVGVDIREEAKILATENAQQLNLGNASFLQGSWFSPVSEGTKFACIVSNPPYIDACDPHLKQGDVRFEPLSALVADEKGMADLSYIATHAKSYLEQDGWLLMEHGYEQGKAVRDVLESLGYSDVATEKDYAGNDRVTLGRYQS